MKAVAAVPRPTIPVFLIHSILNGHQLAGCAPDTKGVKSWPRGTRSIIGQLKPGLRSRSCRKPHHDFVIQVFPT